MTTSIAAATTADPITTHTLAVAMPMRPGAAESFRQFAREVLAAHRDEHDASRRRLGVTRERCWIQLTPQGESFILMLEGQDPTRSNRAFASSTDPYDVWFKKRAGEALGVDFSQPIPVHGEQLYRSVSPSTTDNRQEVALVLPIVTGKVDQARDMAAAVNGPRRDAHADFHRRVGVQEDWYLQPTPDGNHVFIVLLASDDLAAAIAGLARSPEPHDRWFKETLLEVEGVDWSNPPQGPLPELVLDYVTR